MSFAERRSSTRFELKVPVIIRWRDGAEMREARTISEDLSSNGIYFFLPHGISNGTSVEIEMTLPTQVTRGDSLRVRCLGSIQRCEPEKDANVGMAAAIKKYEFMARRNEAPAEKDSSLTPNS